MSKTLKLHMRAGSVRVVKRSSSPNRKVDIALDQDAAKPPEHQVEPMEVPGNSEPMVREDSEQKLRAEFKAGFEEGRRHTERHLRATLEAELDQARQRWEDLVQSLAIQYREFQQSAERDILRLALEIASRIVKRQIRLDAETVVRQIHEATRRVVGVDRVRLRVSPVDEELVRSMRTAILSGADAIRELVVEPDETIEPGGCVLESESGNVDASIQTQLERIEAALLGDEEEQQ